MALTSALNPNVVKTALDKVFFTEYQYNNQPGVATAENASIFKQDSTDRAAVIIEQFAGSGYFSQKTEQADVTLATPRVTNQQTYSVLEWAKGIDISKNFFDDDQHTVVTKAIEDLRRSAYMTRDQYAFQRYALGFTTVTANDSVALFSNSHTLINGGGLTEDNLETGQLGEQNLNAAMISLQTQLCNDASLGAHVPAALLVPTSLFKTAMEVTKSVLRSGTTDNDLNYYSEVYPGLMVYHSPFLESGFTGVTSSVMWYLLSVDHSMYRWVREGLYTAMVDWTQTRNNDYLYKAGYREVVSPISWEGMVGSNGTTAAA